MHSYPKRKFESVGEVVGELAGLAGNLQPLTRLVKGNCTVSPAFRERLMLAVTSVNDCRYCSFVHSRLAFKEGFTHDEVDALLAGSVDAAPNDQGVALVYAQHWAETRGKPDPDARQKLVETYGDERARAIETAIRAIMFGNYFGNTLDSLLFGLSRGKLAAP